MMCNTMIKSSSQAWILSISWKSLNTNVVFDTQSQCSCCGKQQSLFCFFAKQVHWYHKKSVTWSYPYIGFNMLDMVLPVPIDQCFQTNLNGFTPIYSKFYCQSYVFVSFLFLVFYKTTTHIKRRHGFFHGLFGQQHLLKRRKHWQCHFNYRGKLQFIIGCYDGSYICYTMPFFCLL